MAGEKKYIGIRQEAVFGTPLPASQFIDFLSANIDAPSDPQLVFAGSASRAMQNATPGPYVPAGSIEIPVDLVTIGYFLKWALGNWLTEGTAVTASDALDSLASKGATTIVVGDETGFTVGDYVQIGTVAAGDEPEIAQINALDGGAGPTYVWTLEAAIQKNHVAAEAVLEVVAPYKHIYWQADVDNLPSFTLRVGKRYFEHVFQGTTISRMSFNMERGFLTCTMDLVAQKDLRANLDGSAKALPSSLLSFRQGQTTLNADLVGTQQSTTLAVNVAVGDTTIVVDSETNFNAGDFIQINSDEVAQILSLDGGGGPTYSWTLAWALRTAAASTDAVAKPVDTTSLVESYSLELSNNISEEDGVRHGSRFSQEFFVGGVDVSGSLTYAFKNEDEYRKFWGAVGAPSATAVKEFIVEERFIDGVDYLALIMTRAHYGQMRAPVEGRDRIRQEVNFTGVDSATWLGPLTVWLNNSTSVYPE